MPNRLICSVLDEMRKCVETRNFSYLSGLIEECQHLANKMEAALYDQSDLRFAEKKLKDLKKEIRALKEEKEKLGGESSKDELTDFFLGEG